MRTRPAVNPGNLKHLLTTPLFTLKARSTASIFVNTLTLRSPLSPLYDRAVARTKDLDQPPLSIHTKTAIKAISGNACIRFRCSRRITEAAKTVLAENGWTSDGTRLDAKAANKEDVLEGTLYFTPEKKVAIVPWLELVEEIRVGFAKFMEMKRKDNVWKNDKPKSGIRGVEDRLSSRQRSAVQPGRWDQEGGARRIRVDGGRGDQGIGERHGAESRGARPPATNQTRINAGGRQEQFRPWEHAQQQRVIARGEEQSAYQMSDKRPGESPSQLRISRTGGHERPQQSSSTNPRIAPQNNIYKPRFTLNNRNPQPQYQPESGRVTHQQQHSPSHSPQYDARTRPIVRKAGGSRGQGQNNGGSRPPPSRPPPPPPPASIGSRIL